MIEKLIERRDSLKEEVIRATELLARKEAEIKELNETMLRLKGAIQVLDETIEEMRAENQA